MDYEEIEISGFVKGLFFGEKKKDLVVFLPAANGLSIHPRYPRFKWARKLTHRASVLYLSDPYQGEEEYKNSKGSWYVSKEPAFILPEIAKGLRLWAQEKGFKNILFYGSSMGGYAAIVLSSFIQGSIAIAECPQLVLKNHIGSKYVIENIAGNNKEIEKLVDPMLYVKNSKAKKVIIICSIHDKHYRKHISPFISMFAKSDSSLDLELFLYSRSDIGKGHVALPEKEALSKIFNSLDFFGA